MKDQLAKKLARFGQEHLLAFWDELDAPARKRLATQIEAVNFPQIDQLYRCGAAHEDWQALAERAVSPPGVRLGQSAAQLAGRTFSRQEAQAAGAEALAAGQVGVVLVAGGQGSRLGFEHPKGMFPLGPVSRATLFQIHFEKVLATARRYGSRVPVYLMTSPATHDETIGFLDSHDRFGLPAADLTVFCQGTMPAVDAETGKLLLADRGQLFLSPDGHGGIVEALQKSGAVEQMNAAGIRHLFYFQVDNPLAPICDPEFLGFHLLAKSELSTMVIAKQAPEEPLGVVVSVDSRVLIIEYVNLPRVAADRRAADGSLALWAGSIAVHGIDVAFLNRMTQGDVGLPFHVSRKKVPHIDTQGRLVEPHQPNALKFERFIFDLLSDAQRAIVVESDPADCFAPVKNASGSPTDTPETAQAAMIAQHRRWLESAGVRVATDAVVEISPLWALDAEQVVERADRPKRVEEATYLH